MGVVGVQENQNEISLTLNYKQPNNILQAIWINAKIFNVVLQENQKEMGQ